MAATSDVEIANLALDACGARATISSLQERTKEGTACARQYSQALSNVLQAAHWNFARRQVSLTLLLDGTLTPPDAVPTPWVYEYAYPSDCIQGRYIMPLFPSSPATLVGTPAPPYWSMQAIPWLVSSDRDASDNPIRVILTNQPQAVLVYTSLVVDVGMFDDQFITALTMYMAHRLSLPLSGDKTLAKMNYEAAVRAVNAAQASNGNEGLTVIDNVPDWIRVRGFVYDWAAQPGSFFVNNPLPLTMVT